MWGATDMRLIPKLKIAQKLPLALVISAIVVSAGVGMGSYFIASTSLEAEVRQNLATIAFERANQLSVYLQSVENDLVKTSKSDNAIQALGNFSNAWLRMSDADPAASLQKAFIADNPNPLAQRMLLDQGAVTPAYAVTHAHYQPIFRSQITTDGYRDLYLFDLKGNLVYSAAKQSDFATNFAVGGGKFAGSSLGDAYRRAMSIDSPDDLVFADFSAYAGMPDEPMSFFAKPVFDAQNQKLGVIAIAFPPDKLNAVIGYRNGLGVTGDTIIVGGDGLARSESTLTKDSDVLMPTIFDAAVKDAIGGVPEESLVKGFRGADVIEAAAPVDVTASQGWALVAVMNADEVFAPVQQLGTTMLAIGAALLAVVALAGWLFARTITRPISRLTRTMEALADGDLDAEVKGADGHDELGAMARAVQVFRESGMKVRELTEEERAGSEQRRVDRSAMMQALQKAFGAVVDAAIAGDFSRRVETGFPDAELNGLARSVNKLVDTVDRGLGETGMVLSALADTDLTQRMHGEYEGAFGQLKDDTNAVGEKLTLIVTQLRDTSRALKTATGEILSGSNDLSERTSRQAATIEETSAAMEQLAATVIENAKRAEQASLKARAVSQTADEGGIVMGKASDAMERITTSSGKISNIIGLIDDIAFQTNLLALNASVEAARAGEAGKGFAVVAVEVRRLAQSAAMASADIKGLIEVSASEVNGGSKLVAEAAAKLVVMLDAARDNSTLIEAIAAASKEQAASIEEVSSAVRQLDEMTQHNAALVEETNAALEQTEAQATELDRIVDAFSISEIVGEAPAIPPRRSLFRREQAA